MKKGIIARYVLLCFVLVGAPACCRRKCPKPPPRIEQPKKAPKKVKAPKEKKLAPTKKKAAKPKNKQPSSHKK